MEKPWGGALERSIATLGDNKLTFQVLSDTPDLLCVGELCAENGFDFHWRRWQSKPDFERPDGSAVPVVVDEHVPLIAGGALSTEVPAPVPFPEVTKSIGDCVQRMQNLLDETRCSALNLALGVTKKTLPAKRSVASEPPVESSEDATGPVERSEDAAGAGGSAPANEEDIVCQPCKVPLDHNILHLPSDPENCGACAEAKLHRQPSRRADQDLQIEIGSRATKHGERVYYDLVTATIPAVTGERYALTARDEASDDAYVRGLHRKTSEVVANEVKQLHIDEELPWEHIARTDNGGEFTGEEFQQLLSDKEVKHEYGLPNRSQTGARMERWHRTLEEGTAAFLVKANAPMDYWLPAAQHFASHLRTARVSLRTGVTPFELTHGEVWRRQHVPWGCKCIYLKASGHSIRGVLQVW